VIRRKRLSTVGDRSFPGAGCRLWDSLPPYVTSAASTLSVFRNRLKAISFPDHFLSVFDLVLVCQVGVTFNFNPLGLSTAVTLPTLLY